MNTDELEKVPTRISVPKKNERCRHNSLHNRERMQMVQVLSCTTEYHTKKTKNYRNYCWAFDHFSSSSQYGIHGWLDPIPCKNLLIPNRQLEMIQSITINNHPIPPFPTIGSPPTSLAMALENSFKKRKYIYMIYTYTLHIVRCM